MTPEQEQQLKTMMIQAVRDYEFLIRTLQNNLHFDSADSELLNSQRYTLMRIAQYAERNV